VAICQTSFGQWFEFDELMPSDEIKRLDIKSVTVYEHNVNDTSILQTIKFDSLGNLLNSRWFLKDGNSNYWTHSYNQTGKLLRKSNSTWVQTEPISFDNPAPLRKIVQSNHDYEYESGKLKKVVCDSAAYAFEGSKFQIYEYDKRELLTLISYYTEDTTLAKKERYEYDQIGNKSKYYLYFCPDCDLIYSEAYAYDSLNQMIEKTVQHISEHTEMVGNFYLYNQDGNRIRRKEVSDRNSPTTTYQYEYDDLGRLMTLTLINNALPNEHVLHFRYNEN
jgi:YD repeat-containing protein